MSAARKAAAAEFAGTLGLLAIVMVLRFRSGKWRTIELVEPELVEPGN